MVTTTAPSNYLSSGVTDLNRNYLWSKLTDAEQAKYTSSTSTTGTSGTSTSGTTTGTSGTSTTTSTGGKFVSVGTSAEMSGAAFTGRLDSRSATPSSSTLSGFSKLWASDALLQAQLSATTDTASKGGAVFVNFKSGTVADTARPYDGSSGNITGLGSLPRGKNSYGYFSTDPAMSATPFVQQMPNADGSVTETSWSESTGKTYNEWLKTAKSRYDEFEALVTKQQDGLSATFGSGQGLLGYDVNNNGIIDNETELFGFDKGLSLDGSATITSADKLSTQSLTFLTGGRLTGDPLDAAQTSDTSIYRRFMVLGSDGKSTSVLQSSIGYAAGIKEYVTAQSTLSFDSGTATVTAVAQKGFSVSA
ncbi:hypothetical protein [Azospirillum sp. sgz301742]